MGFFFLTVLIKSSFFSKGYFTFGKNLIPVLTNKIDEIRNKNLNIDILFV